MVAQTTTRADPDWAWAAYEPDAERPWNLRQAGHLYRRAAFGADWTQLQRALTDGPQRTVDRLLTPQTDVDAFDCKYDQFESIAGGSVGGLRAWWLRRMIETPHPLQEKMMLFWHGHFATSAAGLKDPRLMEQHIRLLRRHSLGSFSDLLAAISQDPATLTWLGADVNRKAVPNTAFAEPLMETFTLGPGVCTETDVREAARAFTGWFVLRGQLRYIPREHDEGVKHVLGAEGDLAAEDIVRIVLEQPATAGWIVRKLYRWLINEADEPPDALVAPLAKSFAEDYSISRLVETMLRSNLFFSPAAYRQRIKCPVEFAVGIVHAMEGVVSTTELADDIAGLGQDLCHPPTVKGWAGGQYWINAATIARRCNLSSALLQGDEPYRDKLDPWAVARRHGCTTPELVSQWVRDLFVQGDLQSNVREVLWANVRDDSEGALRDLAQAVAALPEFNLA